MERMLQTVNGALVPATFPDIVIAATWKSPSKHEKGVHNKGKTDWGGKADVHILPESNCVACDDG